MIISLYDFTGEAVKPWADLGFECVCFDEQHSNEIRNNISYFYADLHCRKTLSKIASEYAGRVKFLMAWPDCTNMAVSGSKHFEKKTQYRPVVSNSRCRSCKNVRCIWCDL